VNAEISLSYADGCWRARAIGLDVQHVELRGLEELLDRRLAPEGMHEVAIRFDMSSLPAWLRQHQSHYFNYTLRLTPRRDDALAIGGSA
jgi:hypothetical protein